MDLKALKWQIVRGSLAKRVILKVCFFSMAMAAIPYFHIVHDVREMENLVMDLDQCGSSMGLDLGFLTPATTSFGLPLFNSCKEDGNVTIAVFRELMENTNLMDSSPRALCVGKGAASAVSALKGLGLSGVVGVERHPFFSLLRKRFVYELDFKDDYFDFVFSRALDRVSVPALFVLEIERVLRPGGTGALLVGGTTFYSGGLIRSATPVSSFLKSSDIVHVCGIKSYTLVVFKKRIDKVASLEHYLLPEDCESVANNRPFIKQNEPLNGEVESLGTELAYLPTFMDISSRNRLIYINVGAGEFVNSTISQVFKPFYPVKPRSFEAYVVDHDHSVLSSYCNKPGITFVYHPGLGGKKRSPPVYTDDEHLSAPPDEEDFDFVRWFRKTVQEKDFVVLMMNARDVEIRILFELFESGEICRVDELFIRCTDSVDCQSDVCGDCASLFRGLRKSGVFVHRWVEK